MRFPRFNRYSLSGIVATLLIGGFVFITENPQLLDVFRHYESYSGPVPVQSDKNLSILQNEGYTVGYSNDLRNPIWVSYSLNWNTPKTDGLRRPDSGFEPDPRVPNPVAPRDYTNQGYDRGHMAPSFAIGKFHGRQAQLETFLMTNITPQIHAMNAGTWNSIERMEADDFAKRFGQVEIICGPVFGKDPNSFPSGVAIPEGFFKAIRRPDGQTIAFAVPQEAGTTRPENFLVSVAQIERVTGLTLWPDLPPENKELRRTKIW